MSGTEQRLTFRLLSYWNRIRENQEFPSLQKVNISEIAELWHYTFTIEVSPDGLHSFQFFGQELINLTGENLTGELVERAMEQALISNLIGFYDKVLTQRAPVSESSQFYLEGKELRYRSLVVPFSDDGTTINYLLGTTNFKAYD